jgi:tetratricopeptide (TPR) repeat protein
MASWWPRFLRTGLVWGHRATRAKADAHLILRTPLVERALDALDRAFDQSDEDLHRTAYRVAAPHLREAEALLATALETAPARWIYRSEAVRKRALCLAYLGRYEEVLDLVEAHHAEDPAHRGTEYAALALFRLGHEEEALAWADRAIEAGFAKDAPLLYRLRAHLREKRGDEPRAEDDLTWSRWAGGGPRLGDLGRMIAFGALLAAPFALLAWLVSGPSRMLARVFVAVGLVFVGLYVAGHLAEFIATRRVKARLARSPRLRVLLDD